MMDEEFLSPRLRPGARIEQEIPLGHPFMAWLNQYQHEAMDNGGLMRHGVMTVNMGGIEQRYDLVEVTHIQYTHRDAKANVVWRMYGDPADTSDD